MPYWNVTSAGNYLDSLYRRLDNAYFDKDEEMILKLEIDDMKDFIKKNGRWYC